jgi:hypothetical protein
VKVSVEVMSEGESATLRPKKAKVSAVVLKAGKVLVEVGKSANGPAKILDAIQHQNSLLGKLLGLQQQTVLATWLQAKWAQPMMRYLGQIARDLEAQRTGLGAVKSH